MSEKANFKVDPRLASLLGETYRSTEHAVKELVDNSWDADAPTISITLPDPMTANPIIIEDTGTGMTEQELRNEYLVVANDRLSRKGDRTRRLKRLVKGRKGIGKFAGLMVANVMEVETTAREKTTRVVIAKQDLLNASRDLERIDLPLTVTPAPDGVSGTKVTLSELSDRYEFPLPEELKALLMTEYGREEDVRIRVNEELLGRRTYQASTSKKTTSSGSCMKLSVTKTWKPAKVPTFRSAWLPHIEGGTDLPASQDSP